MLKATKRDAAKSTRMPSTQPSGYNAASGGLNQRRLSVRKCSRLEAFEALLSCSRGEPQTLSMSDFKAFTLNGNLICSVRQPTDFTREYRKLVKDINSCRLKGPLRSHWTRNSTPLEVRPWSDCGIMERFQIFVELARRHPAAGTRIMTTPFICVNTDKAQ